MTDIKVVNRGGRDPYWDSLKFVLISLVVLAHMFEPYRSESTFNLTIYNWINMFHMPLFIFVSGRFSAIKDNRSYLKSILRILETFVVFQLIWCVYLSVRGESLSFVDWMTPYYLMWYIFSLALWRVIVYVVSDKVKERPLLWIICGVVISLVAGFIPVDTVFSLQRTLAFLPFFVAGYCSRQLDVNKYIRRVPVWIPIILLMAIFILLIPVEGKVKMTSVFCCATPYPSGNMMWYSLLSRALFIIVATIMSVSVMRLVPAKERFAKWGRQTMVIYIYHAFTIHAFAYLINRGMIPGAIPWLVVYSIIMIVGLLLLSRMKIVTWLLNPISNVSELTKEKRK